jgi:hypothetical protein
MHLPTFKAVQHKLHSTAHHPRTTQATCQLASIQQAIVCMQAQSSKCSNKPRYGGQSFKKKEKKERKQKKHSHPRKIAIPKNAAIFQKHSNSPGTIKLPRNINRPSWLAVKVENALVGWELEQCSST